MKITITCYDTEEQKWIFPQDSHQVSGGEIMEDVVNNTGKHPKELTYHSGERYKFFVKVS
jgi:hypothetical protein